MIGYGLSEIGRVRAENQDRFLLREFSPGHALLAVMDGLGGQAGGALAAQKVHDLLAAFIPDGRSEPAQLHDLILRANEAVLEEERNNPELYGMGTTLTMTLINKGVAHWAHVGDCRLFHCRDARLTRVTTDQNLAQHLFQEGRLTAAELMQSPLLNLLDQALGGSFMEAEFSAFGLMTGDRLLLSSDGLHDQITAEQITAVMTGPGNPEEICHILVNLALKAGGRDNITVVVMEYRQEGNERRD